MTDVNTSRYTIDDIDVIIPAWGNYLAQAPGAAVSAGPARVTIVTDGLSVSDLDRTTYTKAIARKTSTIAGAREEGRAATTGRLVLFLDADDRLMSGALELLLEQLNNNPHCVASCGRFRRTRGGGSWPTWFHLQVACSWMGPLILLFKNVLPTTGSCLMVRDRLPAELFPAWEDEDWHAAMRLRLSGPVRPVKREVLDYDNAPGTVSRRPRDAAALELSQRHLLQPRSSAVLRLADLLAGRYRQRRRESLLKQWNRTTDRK